MNDGSSGHTRIQGAMANLGHKLDRGTIGRIRQDHGIEPAQERGKGMPWSVFLKAHWKVLAASDFFTVEVWSWSGLVTCYVAFVMELATRRVCIAGITTHIQTRSGCRRWQDRTSPASSIAASDRGSRIVAGLLCLTG